MPGLKFWNAYHLNGIFGGFFFTNRTALTSLQGNGTDWAMSFDPKFRMPIGRGVGINKNDKEFHREEPGTDNCGQMVQKFPEIPVKARKRYSTWMDRSIWILPRITRFSIQMVSAPGVRWNSRRLNPECWSLVECQVWNPRVQWNSGAS